MKIIKNDIYFGTISDVEGVYDLAKLNGAGFIKGNEIIIPAGTEILNITQYGGATEYTLKNNGVIINMDLALE